MVNRINKWWKEVMEWKERFEKLFPPSFLQSRAFKKAELKKLEKLLSYPAKKLNEDEKLSQKMLYREQYKQLEKSLYPNPVVRLFRNAGKLALSTIQWTYNKIMKQEPLKGSNQAVNSKPKPANDSEIRDFLKRSLNDANTEAKRSVKAKAKAPANKRKVSTANVKKMGVIVPFKPGKSLGRGI